MKFKSLIGDRAFYKNALAISVPIMIQNGITNLVNLLDNVMVGSIGTESMSGVSIVNQFVFIFNLLIFGAVSAGGIFAAQYADTLAKTCGMSIAVFDRDSVIACSGIPKKEYMERKPSEAIEKIMEKRAFFNGDGENTLVIREDGSRFVSCAMPIQSSGDIVGCVVSVKENGDNARDVSREAEHKLIQTAAGFLGRQLEE